MANTYSAGIATAYGAAVRGGYTGTYEEFCAQQAQYADNAAAVEAAKTDAQQAATAAAASQSAASESASAAAQSATNAGASATAAAGSASEAQAAKASAAASETAAKASETAAAGSATQAAQSASEAAESARTLVLDPTLTMDNQAAEAAATGAAVADLKNQIEPLGLSVVDGAINITYTEGV